MVNSRETERVAAQVYGNVAFDGAIFEPYASNNVCTGCCFYITNGTCHAQKLETFRGCRDIQYRPANEEAVVWLVAKNLTE